MSLSSTSAAEPADRPATEATDAFKTLTAARAAIRAGANAIDLYGDGRQSLRLVRGAKGEIRRATIAVDAGEQSTVVLDWSANPETMTMTDRGRVIRFVSSTRGANGIFRVVDTTTPLDKTLPATRVTYAVDPKSDRLPMMIDTDRRRDGRFKDGAIRQVVSRQAATSLKATVDISSVITMDASCASNPHAAEIEAAIARALSVGDACLKSHDPGLDGIWRLAHIVGQTTVSCASDADNQCAAAVDLLNPLAYFKGLHLVVRPLAFTSQCPTNLGESLFHESMHYVLGPHWPFSNPAKNPNDRVYACQHTCFAGGTLQTCAVCFGVSATDSMCRSGEAVRPAPAVPTVPVRDLRCSPGANSPFPPTEPVPPHGLAPVPGRIDIVGPVSFNESTTVVFNSGSAAASKPGVIHFASIAGRVVVGLETANFTLGAEFALDGLLKPRQYFDEHNSSAFGLVSKHPPNAFPEGWSADNDPKNPVGNLELRVDSADSMGVVHHACVSGTLIWAPSNSPPPQSPVNFKVEF